MRDACLVEGNQVERRRRLVNDLCEMVGADSAEWVQSSSSDRVPKARFELRVRCQPLGELLFARRDGPAFTVRENRLVRWIAAEFPWGGDRGLASGPRFTRRERLVIDLLLQSHGRKEIAKRLGISVNTVQGYIKDIYRRYGVHSHAELLRVYFQSRGGEGFALGSPDGQSQDPLADVV